MGGDLGIEAHLANQPTHAEGLSDAAPIGLKYNDSPSLDFILLHKETEIRSGTLNEGPSSIDKSKIGS